MCENINEDNNKLKFENQDALKPVENLIDAAASAINDKNVTINNSPLELVRVQVLVLQDYILVDQ